MPDFDDCADLVGKWEGGWSDHKADPGGLTRWGWTLKSLIAKGLDVNVDGRIDAQDLAAMTLDDARRLYRIHYWRPVGCDDLPAPLALLVFNSSVNQGPGRAARFLQRAVGSRVDGDVGPKTLAAARTAWRRDPRRVLYEFLSRQMLHYSSLGIFATFGLGWCRRTFDVAVTAGRWLAEAETRAAAEAEEAARLIEDAQGVAALREALSEIDDAVDFLRGTLS